MIPDNDFQLDTVIEGEGANLNFSMGAPLAITMWKKLVLKTAKIKGKAMTNWVFKVQGETRTTLTAI